MPANRAKASPEPWMNGSNQPLSVAAFRNYSFWGLISTWSLGQWEIIAFTVILSGFLLPLSQRHFRKKKKKRNICYTVQGENIFWQGDNLEWKALQALWGFSELCVLMSREALWGVSMSEKNVNWLLCSRVRGVDRRVSIFLGTCLFLLRQFSPGQHLTIFLHSSFSLQLCLGLWENWLSLFNIIPHLFSYLKAKLVWMTILTNITWTVTGKGYGEFSHRHGLCSICLMLSAFTVKCLCQMLQNLAN